jgi:hypothetical protein
MEAAPASARHRWQPAPLYRDPRFKTARYVVLVTGPSATADIEGVLIHGAQGVRSLTVLLVPRPAKAGATG